jgi:Arc/MetJ family transcription regulator
MIKRTTVELDHSLLDRAKKALGGVTTRAAVEAALRQLADAADADHERLAAKQKAYLQDLGERVDLDVLVRRLG